MKQRTIKRPEMPLASLAIPETSSEEQTPIPGVESLPASREAQIENLITIPVSRMRVSPFNARKTRLPKRIAEVAESLKSIGQKDPLYVYPGVGEDEGYFMVLGGETRRLAALQVSLPGLKAMVDSQVNPEDALALTKISKILNDSADECDLDRGLVAQSLISQGCSQLQVADALDLESHTHVQRLLKLISLPKQFITFGQDYPERFSASLGAHIQSAIDRHGEEFAFDLLKKALTADLSHRRIARAVEMGPSGQVSRLQGKRLRRDGGFDIPVPCAPGGRYDVYKSKTPGLKVLKFQVEIPESLAKGLNDSLTDTLSQFIETVKENSGKQE